MKNAYAEQILREALAEGGQPISAGGPSNVFAAALSMGYALQGRPDPFAIHEIGRPKKADRLGAADDLWNALESLKVELGLQGDTPEDLVRSLGRNGGPAWKKEALTKIIRAVPLIEKNEPATDQHALDLLGQAVWQKQEAEPETLWEREIKDVWPLRP